GFRKPALLLENTPQVSVRLHATGAEAQRLVEASLGGGEIAQLHVSEPEVVVPIGKIGTQPDRLPEENRCLAAALEASQDDAQVDMCWRVVRPKTKDLPEQSDGFRAPPLLGQRGRPGDLGVGLLGRGPHGAGWVRTANQVAR